MLPTPETAGSQARVPHRAPQGRHRAGTALKSQINVGCSRAGHKGRRPVTVVADVTEEKVGSIVTG